ncbi:hypothetical protein PPACK8108_LOCUS18159 [Phakopsora pachyrhizi]|uniref:Lactate/malate dehydrogenase C-terminal domain-containing protein n=1 Tax=Phakopsora pachyrhizi TaxID=170000 RepID=A0AAV0BCX1_PHAPC|nr:hypothetical protein PPACK8108_LOCUS18159 [Phakopsora pachyrhizi]
MAYAGFRFAQSLIRAKWLNQSGVVEMAYIYVANNEHVSTATEGLKYFSVPVELGPDGIQKLLPIGNIDDHKKEMLKACIGELKGNISKPHHIKRNTKVACQMMKMINIMMKTLKRRFDMNNGMLSLSWSYLICSLSTLVLLSISSWFNLCGCFNQLSLLKTINLTVAENNLPALPSGAMMNYKPKSCPGWMTVSLRASTA